MSTLSDQIKDFMHLILLSPDKGEGWRNVSSTLRPLAENYAKENPDIFETKDSGGSISIRISERGRFLAEYLL